MAMVFSPRVSANAATGAQATPLGSSSATLHTTSNGLAVKRWKPRSKTSSLSRSSRSRTSPPALRCASTRRSRSRSVLVLSRADFSPPRGAPTAARRCPDRRWSAPAALRGRRLGRAGCLVIQLAEAPNDQRRHRHRPQLGETVIARVGVSARCSASRSTNTISGSMILAEWKISARRLRRDRAPSPRPAGPQRDPARTGRSRARSPG